MSNVNEPCPHCTHIRFVADSLLRLTFANWTLKDTAQCISYIHALMRYQALREEGEVTEKEFVDWFSQSCNIEFQELQYVNPIEPKSFNPDYDFRNQMKNGE